MKLPNASGWTALIGGGISGTSAVVAAWAADQSHPSTLVQSLIHWSFLLFGFLGPFLVLVVGPDYLKRSLQRKGIREASRAVAEVGKRALLWFAVAGGCLILRGLAPLWLR